MSSESLNGTCVEELLAAPTPFHRTAALILLVLIITTTPVLTVAFCVHRNDFAVLRTRANILTYTTVLGDFLQVSWAIDSYMNREGFPCVILTNLILIIFTLQVVPRAITAGQIYHKILLNKKLAKFELVSAINLGNYRGLDLEVKNIAQRRSFCYWMVGHCCEILFSRKREEKALKDTLNLSSRIIGASPERDFKIAMDHFPHQYVFFLASKPLAYSLQIIAIFITIILILAQNVNEPVCLSPCEGVLDMLLLVGIAAIVVTPSIGYHMYQIRNEPDTLGLIWEFRMYNIYGGGLALAACFTTFFDPFGIEEDGRFFWGFLWVLASWIDILFCFGYPLYLAREQEKYRKRYRLRKVSLGKVLESEVGRDLFKAFLVAEMSVENYMFWTSVQTYIQEFSTRTQEENIQVRNAIIGVYLDVDSQLAINISADARESLSLLDKNVPEIDDFQAVTKDVVTNMQADSFTRFTKTAGFKQTFAGEE